MAIGFFRFQPKNPEIRHFGYQIWEFLLFREILQLGKFEGTHFNSDMTIGYQNCCPKHPKKAFLELEFRTFVFEGADLKYEYSFPTFLPETPR